MALQESTESSQLTQKVRDEAAKAQFLALFFAHLRNIATDGAEFTKYYPPEDIDVLRSAADMAMSTSTLLLLAAREQENAVEEETEEWSTPTERRPSATPTVVEA